MFTAFILTSYFCLLNSLLKSPREGRVTLNLKLFFIADSFHCETALVGRGDLDSRRWNIKKRLMIPWVHEPYLFKELGIGGSVKATLSFLLLNSVFLILVFKFYADC